MIPVIIIVKIQRKRRSKSLAIDGQHLAKHIVRLLDIIIGDVFFLICHISNGRSELDISIYSSTIIIILGKFWESFDELKLKHPKDSQIRRKRGEIMCVKNINPPKQPQFNSCILLRVLQPPKLIKTPKNDGFK